MTRLALGPIAQGLLTEVVNHYEDANLDLPERRILAPGAPGMVAWDCEQLTVALASVNVGTGGNAPNLLPMTGSPASVVLTRLATFAIQLVRCSPTPSDDGDAPAAGLLSDAAMLGLDDAGDLSQALVEVAALTPGSRDWLPIGATINAGTVTSLGPDGGFQATEATVTVSAMVTE